MSLWEVPPITFSDGLGWGEPYLYICFNDDCPLYKQGWEQLKEDYAQTASYRCMSYPSNGKFELMPVFSPHGAKGQVIDDQVVLEQEMLKENIKKGFSILSDSRRPTSTHAPWSAPSTSWTASRTPRAFPWTRVSRP